MEQFRVSIIQSVAKGRNRLKCVKFKDWLKQTEKTENVNFLELLGAPEFSTYMFIFTPCFQLAYKELQKSWIKEE